MYTTVQSPASEIETLSSASFDTFLATIAATEGDLEAVANVDEAPLPDADILDDMADAFAAQFSGLAMF